MFGYNASIAYNIYIIIIIIIITFIIYHETIGTIASYNCKLPEDSLVIQGPFSY